MRSVAIFCGARSGRKEAYRQAAEALVDSLLEQDITIVYGGGNIGLMGAIADRAIAGGGRVVGVIPHALVEQEQAHEGLSELIHVNDMHERKQKMNELADGFITLSGGAGSMDELFQEIAHKQVGYHGKPCAILNTAGYYDHLVAWFENAVDEGFITQYWYDQLVIDDSPEELVNRMMGARIWKPLLVYLHGLNSSSQSRKAIQTTEYVQDNQLDLELWIPDLPVFPSDIVQCLQSHLKKSLNLRDIYIIGSSLGGFLGTWLQSWLLDNGHSQKARLVLINPAVVPHERFEEFLGPQKNFHTGADWVMTEEYVEQLLLLEVEPPASPENTLLMVQTGDETLDYRMAVEKYQQCKSIIQPGGSHAFDHFEKMLPEVFDFLGACRT